MSRTVPADRVEARRMIVQAANRHIIRSRRRRGVNYAPTLLSQRQVQWAVFMCRQNGLVSADVLAAAGYRTRKAS